MGSMKRKHPLPHALPADVHARPNRIDTAAVSFRLMDRAARSPFICGMEHVGVRARAGASRCVCDGLRLPCGAALAYWLLLDSNRMGVHTAMCAGRVPALLSRSLLLLLLTSATEGVEMFTRLGVCVSFRLPVKVSQVGVPWFAEEFAAEAFRLEPPCGAEPTLPRYLRDAVCHCLPNSAQEIEVVRERPWVFWEAKARELEASEQAAHEEVKPCSNGKKNPLARRNGESVGFLDSQLAWAFASVRMPSVSAVPQLERVRG